jgi:Protein of unknown function (DUF3037)
MLMADRKQLEFFLLRYVPNAVKDEFVNIGLLVREAGGGGFRQMRVTQDWSRVRCIDPEADVEVLNGLGLQLQRELETQGWEQVVKKLDDLFSNVVQVSAMKACVAEDSAKEADALVNLYLEGPRRAARSAVSGRQVILKGMEEAFENAGVMGFLQRGISLAAYTGRAGDPQKFDFAYGFGNEVRFLQAVSLKTSVERALMLGYGFPAMAREVEAAHGAQVKLTAVVEDGLDRRQAEIGFVLGLMEENQIRVAAVGEMPRIAAEVRVELGV